MRKLLVLFMFSLTFSITAQSPYSGHLGSIQEHNTDQGCYYPINGMIEIPFVVHINMTILELQNLNYDGLLIEINGEEHKIKMDDIDIQHEDLTDLIVNGNNVFLKEDCHSLNLNFTISLNVEGYCIGESGNVNVNVPVCAYFFQDQDIIPIDGNFFTSMNCALLTVFGTIPEHGFNTIENCIENGLNIIICCGADPRENYQISQHTLIYSLMGSLLGSYSDIKDEIPRGLYIIRKKNNTSELIYLSQ